MRRISLFLLAAALLAAASTAAAQTTPRRPPADTLRFGATRPAAGDSITMAEYDEDEADSSGAARADRSDDGEEADGDTVPRKPREGPYARAGGTGPFSVQASGETAARPPRGEVVWLQGRAARPAADSARRDTARAGTGQRVASGQSTRRDTASATTRRDTASSSANRPARRDTASTASNRPTRRDTTATASRPAARDTAGARRNGQTASAQPARPASGTTGGRTGSTSTTTTSTNGRTGSTSTPPANTGGRTGSNSGASSRARTHTVASGETFYGIARRYGVTAAQLRAINPDVDQEQLEIGDVLRLPASARDSRAGSSSSSTQAPRTGSQSGGQRTGNQAGSTQRRTHTVAAGETLFGIARRYGVTVAAIREANEMETDQVRTGQRLVIPPAR
jgi:membrane-bound lytic murein transglycosylase D